VSSQWKTLAKERVAEQPLYLQQAALSVKVMLTVTATLTVSVFHHFLLEIN
jgi:hypothetical protein